MAVDFDADYLERDIFDNCRMGSLNGLDKNQAQ